MVTIPLREVMELTLFMVEMAMIPYMVLLMTKSLAVMATMLSIGGAPSITLMLVPAMI